jgi:hypothetical protein
MWPGGARVVFGVSFISVQELEQKMIVNEINRIMKFTRGDRGFILASAQTTPVYQSYPKKSLEKMIAVGTLYYFEDFGTEFGLLGRKLWRRLRTLLREPKSYMVRR